MIFSSQNFFSYVRDGVLIFTIAALIPVTLAQINDILIPQPSLSDFVNSKQEENQDAYEKEVVAFEKAERNNKRLRCFVYIASGIALLLGGVYISLLSMATGIILGGVFSILFGFTYFSTEISNFVKLSLLILTITCLLGLLYKLNRE